MIWSEYWRMSSALRLGARGRHLLHDGLQRAAQQALGLAQLLLLLHGRARAAASASRVAPSFCMTTGMRCCTSGCRRGWTRG